MTDRPDHTGPDSSGSTPADKPTGSAADSSGDAGSGARSWVVPALLFVAGLLLGGVAVAAVGLGSDEQADPVAEPSVSVSPSPSPSPERTDGPQDVNVRIPASCVEVAEEAEEAFQDVDAFAEAVRNFDARQLQDFLDRFQEVRPRIESLSQECQELAREGVVDGNLVTETPAPTATASP